MITRLPACAAYLTYLRRWARQHPRLTLAGLIALLGAILAWQLTRPGAPFGPQDSTWRRVQINRDLYVGMDPSYPPFAAWTPEQIVGIEADLAREIGQRLGVQTYILIMGFDSLYDALYTGMVDMVIAGLHPNQALTEWVYYSQPYFDAGQVLVSPVSAPIDNMRDLDGKTLAVEMASAGDQAAQRWARRLRSLTVHRFLLPQEAVQAVAEGLAAAALVDTVSAHQYLAQYPELHLSDRTTVAAPYVIAMRKANFRLTAEVERALKAIKSDGTLDAILARWLTGS